MQEERLQEQWRSMAGAVLRTEQGGMVKVCYPGIARGASGPDFKDAVLETDGRRLVCGDVEVHVRASDWYAHGHDSDPAYDNVVLHVLGQLGCWSTTRTSSGREVSVAVLGLADEWDRMETLPCAGLYATDTDRVTAALRAAGHERLLSRAGLIAGRVEREGRLKVLGSLMARALGHSANAAPLQQLGEYTFAPDIRHGLGALPAASRRIQLLGLAGLLPRQRGRHTGDVFSLLSGYAAAEVAVMVVDPAAWRLHGVYPNNNPVRRVVALAEMLPSLEGIAAHLPERCSDGRYTVNELVQLFTVRGDEYWRRHYDFGCRTSESDLVGRSKAVTILIDAVLPWLYAVALDRADGTLRRNVLAWYSSCVCPRPNAVSRHMAWQLGLGRQRLTALISQGLHHIFVEYCRHGLCSVCPLGESHTPV